MKPSLPKGLLHFCLFLSAPALHAQQPAPAPAPAQTPSIAQPPASSQAPPPAQPPASAPRPQGQGQYNSGEGALSLQLNYWLTVSTQPILRPGENHISTSPGDLDNLGKSKPSPGAILSFPAGADNSLRISYFRTQGTGNQTASKDLTLFSTDFATGDYLATRYTLQDVKVSLDFLSYPTPVNASKFRFKTLWEFQYVTIYSSVDAPLKPIFLDSSGNPIPNTGEGSRWFILPTLGAALEHTVTKNFRWEVRFSGFGIPHHASLWDGEASAAYRMNQFELTAGYKGFFFRTSSKSDQYLRGTLYGGFVGVTWYPKF